ncbi:MAG: hypothetical protein AAGJ81_04060 [Verrucomicrobiota bacterium]
MKLRLTTFILLFVASVKLQAHVVYWSETNSDAVFGANANDGSDQSKIRDLDDTGRGERVYGINGITFADDLLYFTAANQDRIYYASTLGTTPRGQFINLDNTFGSADYRPQDITANSDHVYWTDRSNNIIYRADAGPALNRTGAQELISTSGAPRGITVFGDDLYWTDTSQDAIFRSDLDGNDVTQIIDLEASFSGSTFNPGTLTATDQYLFWSDTETDIIYRSDRNGGQLTELIDTDIPSSDGPLGLTTDGIFLYWTTFLNNGINVATLDGIILDEPRFTPSPDPTASGFNVNALAIEYLPEPSYVLLSLAVGLAVLLRRRVRQ